MFLPCLSQSLSLMKCCGAKPASHDPFLSPAALFLGFGTSISSSDSESEILYGLVPNSCFTRSLAADILALLQSAALFLPFLASCLIGVVECTSFRAPSSKK